MSDAGKKVRIVKNLKNYLLSSDASSRGGLSMGFRVLHDSLAMSDFGIDLEASFGSLDRESEQKINSDKLVFLSGRAPKEKDFFLLYNPNKLESVGRRGEDYSIYAPVVNVKKFSGASSTFISISEIRDSAKRYWDSFNGNYVLDNNTQKHEAERFAEQRVKREQERKKLKFERNRVESLIKQTSDEFYASKKVTKVENKYFLKRGMENIIDFIDVREKNIEVKGVSVRVYMIPLYNINMELKNYQMIDDNGNKTFSRKDVPVHGLFSIIGDPDKTSGPIIFAEGLSSLWTSKKITEHWVLDESGERVVESESIGYTEGKSPTYVFCLNSGGLVTVSGLFDEKYPDKLKINMSDNDRHKIHAYNAGQCASFKCSFNYNSINCAPVFDDKDCVGEYAEDNPTDWDDFYRLYGLERSKEAAFRALDYSSMKITYAELLLKNLELAGCSDAWQHAKKIILPDNEKTDVWTFIYGMSLVQEYVTDKAFYLRDKSGDRDVKISGKNKSYKHVVNKSVDDNGQPIPTIRDIPLNTLFSILSNQSSKESLLSQHIDPVSLSFIDDYVYDYFEKNKDRINSLMSEFDIFSITNENKIKNLNEKSLTMIVENRESKIGMFNVDKRRKSVTGLSSVDFIKNKILKPNETFCFSTNQYEIVDMYVNFGAESIKKQVNNLSVIIKDIVACADNGNNKFHIDLLARVPVASKTDWYLKNMSDRDMSVFELITNKEYRLKNPESIIKNSGVKLRENRDVLVLKMAINKKHINLGKILLSNMFCEKITRKIGELVKRRLFKTVSSDKVYADHVEMKLTPIVKAKLKDMFELKSNNHDNNCNSGA